MARRRRTWYSEQGTEERPSSVPGMVELYRAGKFISLVPATPSAADIHNQPAESHSARMARLDSEVGQ